MDNSVKLTWRFYYLFDYTDILENQKIESTFCWLHDFLVIRDTAIMYSYL